MARFGKDMLVYAVADLLGSAVGIVLSPVFTRLFTPEQYGAQAALTAIWAFAGLPQYGGMDSAYPFFRSMESDGSVRRKLMVTATFVALTAAVVVSATFLAVSLLTNWITNFTDVSRWEAASFALTLLPGSILAWFLLVLRFERRAFAYARVNLLGRVGGALAVIPALVLAAQGDRLTVGFLVTGVLASLAVLLGWRELTRLGMPPFESELFDRTDAHAMLRYGMVLVPASAIYAASTVVDRLLVTAFHGQAETAVLALALRIGALAAMLRTWFALVWDPQLVDWIATVSPEALNKRLGDTAALIARVAAILVCLAAIWTEPVVMWLYPRAYWDAVPLVPWIVCGVAISSLSIVAVAAIIIGRKPKFYLPVYAVGLVVNIAIGLWAVPQFGAIGAVAGALVGEICILLSWIFIGVRILRNVLLPWGSRVSIVAAAGLFAAIYTPEQILEGWPMMERSLITLVIFSVLGIPAFRRLWVGGRQLLH